MLAQMVCQCEQGIAYPGGSLPFAFAFASGCMPSERVRWLAPNQKILRKDFQVTHFRSFDMIMEIISECLDVGNGFLASLCGEMSGKENCRVSILFKPNLHGSHPTKCYVANLAVGAVGQPMDALKLEGRLIPEQDLRCVLYGSSSSINELLWDFSGWIVSKVSL